MIFKGYKLSISRLSLHKVENDNIRAWLWEQYYHTGEQNWVQLTP